MPSAPSITEHRVVLPLHIDEYQAAQLWSVAEASKNETGGGEGIEVKTNEPFDENTNAPTEKLMGGKYTTGQYTHKIYHLASRVPGFIRLVAPKGSLEIHEKAWNAYPYCRTIVTNPDYMKEGFFIKIETLHVADNGESENVHNLNSEDLGIRKIERIDIANDSVRSSDYKEEWDPSKFKSEKTGRGPLTGADWNKRVDPVMCCYKLVSVKFKWFGLQNRVEKFIQQQERRIFLNFHRQLVCWMDKWYGLSMQDIREIEDRTKRELDEARATGEVRGTKAEEEKETKGAKK